MAMMGGNILANQRVAFDKKAGADGGGGGETIKNESTDGQMTGWMDRWTARQMSAHQINNPSPYGTGQKTSHQPALQ